MTEPLRFRVSNQWFDAYMKAVARRRKGATNRRILKEFRENGRLWQYHATKGWRSYRA